VVIVAGTLDVAPERREAFLGARAESIQRSRQERGCIEYCFAADSLDAGRVRVFEIWESRGDLEAHQQTMRDRPPAGDVPVLDRDVRYYEVSASEPLTQNPASR